MTLTNENKNYAATVLNLLEEISNKNGSDIFCSITKGESKSSFYLNFIQQIKTSSFLLFNKQKQKSFKVGLYIKISNKRISPWRYTFLKSHQKEIRKMHEECKNVFVLLIAGNDGVVLLNHDNLKKLLDEQFEATEWLSVSRKYNQYYRVDGHDRKKKINIPKNAFPDEIVDQISNFKS